MLACDYCQQWFHYDCCGLRPPGDDEDDDSVAPPDFKCPACCLKVPCGLICVGRGIDCSHLLACLHGLMEHACAQTPLRMFVPSRFAVPAMHVPGAGLMLGAMSGGRWAIVSC